MKCHNCGTEAQKGDKFCLKCGAALADKSVHTSEVTHNSYNTHEEKPITLPAEQAEKILTDARKMVKHLSNQELVMGGASILSLLSFFLPWYGGLVEKMTNGFSLAAYDNWLYLLPLLAIASLIILYFSQGTKHNTKVFLTTIQAVIGMYIFTMGIQTANNSSMIGVWLTIIAGLVLTGVSLYFQKTTLLKA